MEHRISRSTPDALSDRKKLILRAVVDAYVTGGEPVGSKFLLSSTGIGYSSATIRNEMAELEEMGYLIQPHTSAGRVPSDRGYRFYVDSLMESYRMTASELAELQKLVRAREAKMDKILDRAARLMGSMTNYAAITATPAQGVGSVLQFRTVMISDGMMLLVMVVESGGRHSARTAYVDAPGVSAEDAARIESVLNRHIAGVPIDSITLPQIMRLRAGLDSFGCGGMVDGIMESIYGVVGEDEGEEIHLDGINHLLSYKEYSDPEKLGGLLESIEDGGEILDIVRRGENEGVNVYIGSESGAPGMQQSSLVFKKIVRGGRVIGAIGVIGPRRMKYNRVISMLDYLSKGMSGMLGAELPGIGDRNGLGEAPGGDDGK